MKFSKHLHLKNKIIDVTQHDVLSRKLACWRFRDKSIVFTNGCFDLLHAGHIDYLARAADLGHILLVGLNSDASVASLKGAGKPFQHQEDRALILSALSFVSCVVIFPEETPEKLIHQVRPNILVKGQDYAPEEIAGGKFVLDSGGEVITLPLLPERSTSALAAKISGKTNS